jgi:DNA-binding Lrp family transcriptional regulator
VIHPDDLDRKIMREMESPESFRWNIRESYASIAKRLGVDEETVRKRVERVRQSGILQGWQLIINPHLIGRESASIELEVGSESAKNSAISQLKLTEGIISILSFHGRQLQVGFYYRNEKALARQISLMESICGCRGSMLWNVSFPPFRLKMSRTDWMILDALRKDPRTKLSDLAREVKVSTRTLNRRIERMIQGWAFFLHAAIDLKKLGGLA